MNISHQKYENAPIQEVVCEIHFQLSEPLSKERIELFKTVWAKDYPDQKVVEEKELSLQIGPEGLKSQEKELGCRLICKSANKERLVQLSGRFLAVNHLKPYPGWEEFFRDFAAYQAEVVRKTVGDLDVRRVGLRYVNRIDIPESPLVWSKWFNLELPFPVSIGKNPEVFQMQFQKELGNDRRLIVKVAKLVSAAENLSTVVLGLDAIWEGEPKKLEFLPELLEGVHRPLGLAFEGYLGDNLRELFKPITL